ncbi:MAG TPA: F0F1 ATP synthase subunit epsilon [Alphaproteobacteria bacterium]|nr:F0F1 ATP synthase subunit epsilon [Alphaproteobacteria bacterium]
MRLIVATPLAIVIDTDEVVHVRAEDPTGAFGILRGHAEFLTALEISVVSWRDEKGVEHYVAVRGGMLEVKHGEEISIATREAVPGDDLAKLEDEVLVRFRRNLADEKAARMDAERLYLSAMQRIYRLVRPAKPSGVPLRPGDGQLDWARR